MSQNSLVVPNTGTLSGLTMVNDLNAAVDSLNSTNSGGSGPASAVAFSQWADSTTSILKQRNSANSAWLKMATLDDALIIGKSANYTIVDSDFDSFLIATNTMTYTLPAAGTVGSRWRVKIGNGSGVVSGTIVVDVIRQGSDTMDSDNATSIFIYAGESIEFFSDGSTHWWTRGRRQLIEKRGAVTLPASGTGSISVTVSFSIYPRSFSTVLGCVVTPSGFANNVAGGVPSCSAHNLTATTFDVLGDLNGYTIFNQSVPCYWYAWGV